MPKDEKVIAHTATKVAKILGLSRVSVYNLLARHDPETGGTVLVEYIPPGIDGWEEAGLTLITAESVRREKARREGEADDGKD